MLDRGRREVAYQKKLISLTALEFRILECLMNRPGRVFSRSDLLEAIHADDIAVVDRSIDVHVCSIRRKLGVGGGLIATMRGFGYRVRDDGASLAALRDLWQLVGSDGGSESLKSNAPVFDVP